MDIPGAMAQIHYETGEADLFCSTLDMFSFYLQPDRPKHVTGVFVNDMARADWKQPVGYWIDAQKAFYIHGGNVMVPMGEALVPFRDENDAQAYRKDHGGTIISFDDVTMEMLRPAMRDMGKKPGH